MSRPRAMRLRGRITLAALALLGLGAALLFSPWVAEESFAGREREPAVSDIGLAAPEVALRHLPLYRDSVASWEFQSEAERSRGGDRLVEELDVSQVQGRGIAGPLRIEYSLDRELTWQVRRILTRAHVRFGHVIVLDPATGKLLAYVSTNAEEFSPTQAYPAASLIKVVTAAATLHYAPEVAERPCRFRGSPYRLTRARIDPPQQGREVSFGRALATSNNQCFAQFAVHDLGRERLVDTIDRFGFLRPVAPGHAAGAIDAGEDAYGLGRMGCGLSGCRITPLHAAQMAAVLATGQLVAPRWIERITDGLGRELVLPEAGPPQQILSLELAAKLRTMLVGTTRTGTARKAFRTRRGWPLLGPVQVAGKTGSLSGENPTGRYEWFIGVAPAKDPRVAIAVLTVQNDLWWKNASQIGAEVLEKIFCEKRVCRAEAWAKWVPTPVAESR